MESYILEPSIDVPTVDFNPNGKLRISGRSFPEDTIAIYLPILEWVDSFIETNPKETTLQFDLDYFNSSTYKAFLNILLKLEKILETGNKVKIEWLYKERDIDMKEAGEEFSELVDIPFIIQSK